MTRGKGTVEVDKAKIEASKEVEISDDKVEIAKVATMGRVAEQAISAAKWTVAVVAICIVIGLAVVYGKSAAASVGHMFTISTGETTGVP